MNSFFFNLAFIAFWKRALQIISISLSGHVISYNQHAFRKTVRGVRLRRVFVRLMSPESWLESTRYVCYIVYHLFIIQGTVCINVSLIRFWINRTTSWKIHNHHNLDCNCVYFQFFHGVMFVTLTVLTFARKKLSIEIREGISWSVVFLVTEKSSGAVITIKTRKQTNKHQLYYTQDLFYIKVPLLLIFENTFHAVTPL